MAAYWLFKSEPDVFSYDHLVHNKREGWDGVRNYQARNFMRSMAKGDQGIFYHSNATPPGVAGILKVVKTAEPDPTQFDPNSKEGRRLTAVLKPGQWIKLIDRLGEIDVPALILAGEQDQIVPLESTRLVADHIPTALMVTDPECGHTVRSSFRGYDGIVESFLAEGD